MTIPFKRIKEVLKPKYYKDFNKFMEGQTVCVDGVYDDDFFRWLLKLEAVD